MIDGLKEKLRQKTVEANRLKKKVQQLEKAGPEEERDTHKPLSALDELLARERQASGQKFGGGTGAIQTDERRVLMLKAAN